MCRAKPPRAFHVILFSILLYAGARRLYANTAQAEILLHQGRVDEASSMLQQALTTQTDDARAHLLLCRVYYAQDMGNEAVRECEAAVAKDPSNSEFHLWLGKAYGLKASQQSMLSAFGTAKKVRTAFERAVELDPSNAEAMSVLGEFYVDAPGVVGGGLDKAQALAPRLLALSSAKGHRLLALIAEKKGDKSKAEAEFKKAAAAAQTPEAYLDLAAFYQRRGQPDKAVAAIELSIEANRTKNAALVDVASLLTTLNRSPEIAERVLREYLASNARSDDAPAFKVHVQLGDLLQKRGDTEGARREYAAAVALASNYAPARKALQGA